MGLFMLVLLCPCLYLLFIFLKWANVGRHQSCYILGYECYKPTDDRKISTQISGEIVARNKQLGLDEYRFLLKAIVSSGIGEHSYGPRNVLLGHEESPTLSDSWSEMDEFFQDSVRNVLSKAGVTPREIDVLVVNVSMFAPVPSLASRIANHYKMREDIKVYNLSGMGCSASLISINAVQSIFKHEKEKFALVVTSESLSPNWYAGKDRSMILSNCLFRSGGCAILLTNKWALRNRAMFRLKCLLRTHHGANDDSYECCTQMEDSEGRLGFHLSKSLPKAAARALADNLKVLAPRILPGVEVARFVVVVLTRRFRSSSGPNKAISSNPNRPNINFKTGVDHFCLHTGGKAVIDGLKENLKLSEYDVEPARMTLHRFGNTSASSLWYVLGYMEAKKRLKRGDRVLMVSFGAGFKCNSCLWEVVRDLEGSCDDNAAWKDCISEYPPKTLANPYLERFGWIQNEDPSTFKMPLEF